MRKNIYTQGILKHLISQFWEFQLTDIRVERVNFMSDMKQEKLIYYKWLIGELMINSGKF